MIRPITIVSFLLACGSGLYLYQSKHEVQLLDRTIERTVHDTGALREQSRLLAAEWTMLNDPDRLRQFSDTYLNLKSINPAQFTSLNDLDGKLPAPAPVVAPSTDETPVAAVTAPVEAEPTTDAGAPGAVTSAGVAPAGVAPGAVAEDDAMPVPPVPVARPVQAATPLAHPIEARVAIARPAATADVKPAEPRAADQRGPEQRAPDQRVGARVAEVHPDVRTPSSLGPRPIVLPPPRAQSVYTQAQPQPVPQPLPQAVATRYRPAPVAAAPAPAVAPPALASPGAAPFSGSLLGMARGSMPPAPRPTPVNATYNAN
jgi:hypothetical protein